MRRFKSPWQAAEKTGFDELWIADALETGLPYNGFFWKYKECEILKEGG
jgi:alkanesulfonate monooxygenase SsuD/methylene tetrahydromethanopterin reductase-like flavin-dependent oxidoreductase (luciferase family)